MNDVSIEQSADLSPPSLVTAPESPTLPLPFRAPAMPKCAEGFGALNAGPAPARHAVSASRAARPMLCIEPLSGFAVWTERTGFIDAYDHGDFVGAPLGALALVYDDPDRGKLVAELTARGWEFR